MNRFNSATSVMTCICLQSGQRSALSRCLGTERGKLIKILDTSDCIVTINAMSQKEIVKTITQNQDEHIITLEKNQTNL